MAKRASEIVDAPPPPPGHPFYTTFLEIGMGWAWAWVVAGGNGRWAEGLRGVAGGDVVPLRSIEPSVGSPVELGTWAQIQLRSLTCKLDPPLGSGAWMASLPLRPSNADGVPPRSLLPSPDSPPPA